VRKELAIALSLLLLLLLLDVLLAEPATTHVVGAAGALHAGAGCSAAGSGDSMFTTTALLLEQAL
jgi:hypothetical protein